MRRLSWPFRLATVAVAVLLLSVPADAYLRFTVSVRGISTVLAWRANPVRWFARDASASGVPATALQNTVNRAFSTWQAVPTSAIAFSFVGFTGASPFADDGLNVIGFQNEPGEDRVLGSTGFTIDIVSGEILEADIFINAAFAWSTSDAGDPARFDLESVVTHEIGHFLGLGHSALGETQLLGPDSRRVLASGSVMFPISFGRGNTLDRTLQPDDVAGVSVLYPEQTFTSSTGSIRGRVQKDGRGIFGAHVVAFNVQTGTLIGAFTLDTAGEFEISGLSPGPHIVRVEPLDDASVESFFDAGDGPVDVNFAVTYGERLVVVAAGRASDAGTIAVRPK